MLANFLISRARAGSYKGSYLEKEPHRLSGTSAYGHCRRDKPDQVNARDECTLCQTTNVSRSATAHDPTKNLWQVNVGLRYG
jgi:hypothetical protein